MPDRDMERRRPAAGPEGGILQRAGHRAELTGRSPRMAEGVDAEPHDLRRFVELFRHRRGDRPSGRGGGRSGSHTRCGARRRPGVFLHVEEHRQQFHARQSIQEGMVDPFDQSHGARAELLGIQPGDEREGEERPAAVQTPHLHLLAQVE